jgi:hypothetical protein
VLQGLPDGPGPVVGTDHHGDEGVGAAPGERALPVGPPHGVEGRLRTTVSGGDPEAPVQDLLAAPVPLVGPGEDHGPGAPAFEGRPDLPLQGLGLGRLPMGARVQPQFRHEEGPVPGQVLQAGQIGPEVLLLLQVDVEAQEIQEGELGEILGGGIVHVGDQGPGVRRLHLPIQPLQESLHPGGAVPADDGRRDLVPHRPRQDGRMSPHPLHLFPDPLQNALRWLRILQESHVLLPGQPHQDPESMGPCGVEHPQGRDRIGADGVDPAHPHEVEVTLHPNGVPELLPLRPQGTVGDPADQQFLLTHEEELPLHPGPLPVLDRHPIRSSPLTRAHPRSPVWIRHPGTIPRGQGSWHLRHDGGQEADLPVNALKERHFRGPWARNPGREFPAAGQPLPGPEGWTPATARVLPGACLLRLR